jgi:DNA-binding response OmpR family regulator
VKAIRHASDRVAIPVHHCRMAEHIRFKPSGAAQTTAFARSEDRPKALRSGFEVHLAKPVDPAGLVASVATLAGRVRAESSSAGGVSARQPRVCIGG